MLNERGKKSFLSLQAHWAALISVSLALSQTPVLHCKTMDMGLVHRVVCLFTSQLSLVLIVLTHGRMATLS